MNKRGISHVEVILAFVLFIAAVGFGLYFFNTGNSDRLVDSVLSYALREIEQNTTVKLERFTVDVRGISAPNILAINFAGVSGKVRVETIDGRRLDSKREGDLVYVRDLNLANDKAIFVTFGEEFEDEEIEDSLLNESFYEIGSSEVREVLSERRLLALNHTYYEDYLGLKGINNFNLPNRADFGFSVVFDDGRKIIAEQEIPSGFEVFTRNKRVEILKIDGKTEFADLIVKAW